MAEQLEDSVVLSRFNKSCGLFEKYRELDLDIDFAPYDDPLPFYEQDRDDLAVLKSLLGSKGIEAEQKADAEEEVNEIESEIATLKDSILYFAVIDCTDRIYSDILKYGRMIAKDPERFGMKLSALELKILDASIIKSELDDDKNFIEAKKGMRTYPAAVWVEPLFNNAIRNYLLG
jgi:hypothetical protein